MLLNIILVGFGGALGAVSRFVINEILYKNFSFISLYSNLVVNIIGCFLVGFIIGATIPVKDSSYYFFIIGFLGSFTTMSAFTHETIMIANTNLIQALSYIMLTVILTIFATFIGAWITK